MLIIDYFH